MKYCVRYDAGFRYKDKVDEFLIDYDATAAPDKLFAFVDNHKKQQIVINILNDLSLLELKTLKGLYGQTKRIKLLFDFKNKEMIKNCQELEIPYFFRNYASNWDIFFGLISLNPTDIYITEALGFELDKAAAVAHKHNIQVRVFPNVAQAATNLVPTLKRFFIRPEDINDIYENYVDVCEFYCNTNRQSVYYKIYAIDKKWDGTLDEVIVDAPKIHNKAIPNIFGKTRLKCGKRCLKDSSCSLCESIKIYNDSVLSYKTIY